jgi:hypothetical protein
MTFQELVDVMKFITDNNSPRNCRRGYPVVKYADPVLDFRTNTCFIIKFRGFGSERSFYCQNEFRDHPKSLKDRVMEYLTASETTEVPAIPTQYGEGCSVRFTGTIKKEVPEKLCTTCRHERLDLGQEPCINCTPAFTPFDKTQNGGCRLPLWEPKLQKPESEQPWTREELERGRAM